MIPFETVQLRLTQPGGADAGIGADTLATVLTGLQRCVWALAALAQGPDFKAHARFKRRYELRCLLALEGDRLPLTVGPRQLELDFESGDSPEAVFERLWALWLAVAAQDRRTVEALLPEGPGRDRVFAELGRVLPRARELWRVALVRQGHEVMLEAGHAPFVASLAGESGPKGTAVMTVLGELVGVDFVTGTFHVRYAPTGRALGGKYPAESEVWLLKHRRKLIQVTGEFALDGDDWAHALKRLIKLGSVDLSPVTCAHLAIEGQGYEVVPPLVLTPVVDEADQLFEVREDTLGLTARAGTREELGVALRTAMERLWTSVRRDERPDVAKAWNRRLKAVAGAMAID